MMADIKFNELCVTLRTFIQIFFESEQQRSCAQFLATLTLVSAFKKNMCDEGLQPFRLFGRNDIREVIHTDTVGKKTKIEGKR